MNALSEEHVAGPEGRSGSRLVRVEEEEGTLRVPGKEAGMLLRERGPEGRHRVFDFGRGEGDDVHVAFHHERDAFPPDRVPVTTEGVQDLALVVDTRLGRVHVLGNSLLLAPEDPAAEGHDVGPPPTRWGR